MRDLRAALRIIQTTLGVALWLLETVWIGGKALRRSAMLLLRWRRINAQVLLCPRGHRVPVYGLWDCACGSRFDGWAFARCVNCHETGTFLACGVCGLPVRNPLWI